MDSHDPCPLCGSDAHVQHVAPDDPCGRVRRLLVECPTCVRYTIPVGLRGGGLADGHVLSAVARRYAERGETLDLTAETAAEYVASTPVPRTPLEAMDLVLQYLAHVQPTLAEHVPLEAEHRSVAFCRTPEEFFYLRENLRQRGLVEVYEFGQGLYRLSVAGWQRVDELARTGAKSNQAFVAMSFGEALRPVFTDAIKPALEATGFDAYRVDHEEHNDDIVFQILAEIRRSALLVADFTEHKKGVYFEAGVALGEGIPVIWCCRADDLDDAHFDISHYNHIAWRDVAELRERLETRIRATIPGRATGRGRGRS